MFTKYLYLAEKYCTLWVKCDKLYRKGTKTEWQE